MLSRLRRLIWELRRPHVVISSHDAIPDRRMTHREYHAYTSQIAAHLARPHTMGEDS